MESFDSLLTCCICLDRYRNPKLLPCQHSFCMEPCMEGLIDYVKRQVKCPECRAEHRVPYKGIQDFPSNVTMQRFLDMYHVISGELPDPNQGQVMERCSICNEKDYLKLCAHCEKKICPECRVSHVEVLKREVSRINSQIKRGLHRLYDSLQSINKSSQLVKQNCLAVRDEVDLIGQRLVKAIKDRTECLKTEVESHMDTEMHTLETLRSNLEQEISNIESNSELAEKHMQDDTEWDDCELMDAKDMFLKTVEFIRNFDQDQCGGGEYRKPIRFSVIQDPNTLSKTLEHFGELNITRKEFSDSHLTLPTISTGNTGLMRSKSDHRLVAQMRHQEERTMGGYVEDTGRHSPMNRRRFGERFSRRESDAPGYSDDLHMQDAPPDRRHKYRSRYTRRNLDTDDDMENYRHDSHTQLQDIGIKDKRERERVLETEDATRGPLSGIARISDIPRVIQKLSDVRNGIKQKKEPTKAVEATPTAIQPVNAPWRRQKYEEDEISKIKLQNKEIDMRSSSTLEERTTPRNSNSNYNTPDRSAVNTSAPIRARISRDESSSENEDSQRRRSRISRPLTDATISEVRGESVEPLSGLHTVTNVGRKTGEPEESIPARPSGILSRSSSNGSISQTETRATIRAQWERRVSRSNSSDSTNSESSNSNSKPRTGAMFTTSELRRRFQHDSQSSSVDAPNKTSRNSNAAVKGQNQHSINSNAANVENCSQSVASSRPRFQSRFLGRPSTPKANTLKQSESSEETSSESDSDTSSDSDSDDNLVSARDSLRTSGSETMPKTSIGPLLARSAQARNSASDSNNSGTTNNATNGTSRRSSYMAYNTRRESSEFPASSNFLDRYSNRYDTSHETKVYEPRFTSRYSDYSANNSLARSRTSSHLESRSSAADEPYSFSTKYGRSPRPSVDDYTPHSRYSSYSSRFLNRSKSSAALEDSEKAASISIADSESVPGVLDGAGTNGKSRYVVSGNNRPWVARSRSSERAEIDNESHQGASSSVNTDSINSEFAPDTRLTDVPSATKQTHRSTAPHTPSTQQQQHSTTRSTHHDDKNSTASTTSAAGKSEALSSWAQYLKNKYSHRNKEDRDKSKDGNEAIIEKSASFKLMGGLREQENFTGKISDFSGGLTHGSRATYLQKGKLKFQVGQRGGGPGCFMWPRGVAVGPDNTIVVADSSNHRVQVFDRYGQFVREFGQYGCGEAEFDGLAGVTVNRIGQFIISDRYNHRVQLFDPCGRFLGTFGQNGTAFGRFNYPWGVTIDALGFIYVCDKENHRVQVFQSDSTFVGAFGGEGASTGQMEHPHYIAVSATNRVVVTDSNNHRVQVFDINGKCLTTFGGEGSDEGKFKFPRGVAVDDDGFIVVCDSGNNRIQIFNPDCTFLKAFGSWGSGDSQFKGLEGVAVMSDGTILVSDRENHRIQVF